MTEIEKMRRELTLRRFSVTPPKHLADAGEGPRIVAAANAAEAERIVIETARRTTYSPPVADYTVGVRATEVPDQAAA